MQIINVRTLITIIGAIIAIAAMSEDNVLSRELTGKPLRGENMNNSSGLTIPEGHERATFALG